MFKKRSKYHHTALIHWRDFRLKIFFEGIIIGVLAGILVVMFRYALEKAELLRGHIYIILNKSSFGVIALWFVLLILIAFCLQYILKKEPMSSGSGIPQIKGILLGHFKMNWASVIVGKFIGGVLAIGSGLSLGREGPSIQLGAAMGQGVSRLLGRLRMEEKFLITSGASAGLAAAFNAPLAGVIFSLEELHKNFSPAVLMSSIAASLTADFVTQQFFGQKSIFDFSDLPVLPLSYYVYLIGLGLICGCFGFLFNWLLIKTLNINRKQKWLPKVWMIALPLLLGGVLGFFLPETLGGGNQLIDSVGHGSYTLTALTILILVKFLFTMISYGCGVPGGIFLPMLVIGALTGAFYGNLMISFLHVNQQYYNNFIVLAMAAYFTAVVKAPITGSILITEMTGSFHHLLALITVSMTAYLVSDILRTTPIYEKLLDLALVKEGHPVFQDDDKTVIEVAVCIGSKLNGKKVKDFVWPAYCLLVGIKRGETEIIPKGDTRIHAGDYLLVLSSEKDSAEIRKSLAKIADDSF